MSEKTKEKTVRLSPTAGEDTPTPATKRTAKKATKKVAAKKVAATKVTETAEKPPAKKATARKAASKAAANAQVELPLDVPTTTRVAAKKAAKAEKPEKAEKPASKPVAAEIPAPREPAPEVVEKPVIEKRVTPRAIRAKAIPVLTPPPDPQSQGGDNDENSPRYGRVPGGGPVAAHPFEVLQQVVPPQDQRQQPYQERQQGQQGQRRNDNDPRRQNNDPRRNDRGGNDRGGRNDRQPHFQNQGQNPNQNQSPDGRREPQGESRSKRRRDKRKRRRDQEPERRHGDAPEGQRQPSSQNNSQEQQDRRPAPLTGPRVEIAGMLELAQKGFGFLRLQSKNFEQARDDIFVTPETIRRYHLRLGQWIEGVYQEGPRGPQLVDIERINGMTPEEASKLPHFDELKAINPNKRISFETTPERFTTRVVDLMAPVGRGQRGLIVSPPRSGKTTLLLHMAEAVREKYEDSIHLMILLVDERPEEVTEFRRTLPGAEIYASSNDENARSHCRIAELAIERAKRLVEAGKDVFLLMDSITRLARAYNGSMRTFGRGTGSGGITIGALEVPRRLFAAARNTRGGGSLTILATALIQTNSRADEAIFMEFKGTGNMELVLDRKIAENYVYPAVDIFKSGTRREELLLADHMLHKVHLIRRGLAGHRPVEAMERLLFFLKKFPNNPQMLLEIKG